MNSLTNKQLSFYPQVEVSDSQFIETMFDIAFGEDSIRKEYTRREVIVKLQEYCEDSYRYEVMCYVHDKVKVEPESVSMNTRLRMEIEDE